MKVWTRVILVIILILLAIGFIKYQSYNPVWIKSCKLTNLTHINIPPIINVDCTQNACLWNRER